jgi:hypothetical protein
MRLEIAGTLPEHDVGFEARGPPPHAVVSA